MTKTSLYIFKKKKNVLRFTGVSRWILKQCLANGYFSREQETICVQIGIAIVCEFQNLQIGIGIILFIWEVLTNYSQYTLTKNISLFSHYFLFLTQISF